jgi:hypothetical protein
MAKEEMRKAAAAAVVSVDDLVVSARLHESYDPRSSFMYVMYVRGSVDLPTRPGIAQAVPVIPAFTVLGMAERVACHPAAISSKGKTGAVFGTRRGRELPQGKLAAFRTNPRSRRSCDLANSPWGNLPCRKTSQFGSGLSAG